jgi:hypothetical protein
VSSERNAGVEKMISGPICLLNGFERALVSQLRILCHRFGGNCDWSRGTLRLLAVYFSSDGSFSGLVKGIRGNTGGRGGIADGKWGASIYSRSWRSGTRDYRLNKMWFPCGPYSIELVFLGFLERKNLCIVKTIDLGLNQFGLEHGIIV